MTPFQPVPTSPTMKFSPTTPLETPVPQTAFAKPDVGPAQFVGNIADRGITLWDPEGPVEQAVTGIGEGLGDLFLQANEAMPWGGNDPSAIGIDTETGAIDPSTIVPFGVDMASTLSTGVLAAPVKGGVGMGVRAVVGDGVTAPSPTVGAVLQKLLKGGGKSPLREALDAKARQMDLPVEQRIQPDPNRGRFVDSDYHKEPTESLYDPIAADYPRMPEGMTYPKGDRARVLIDNREEIAQAIAEKIRAAGQVGANTQFFYHSAGPLFRAAQKAGLSAKDAAQWVRDFSQHVGATSPRTQTQPNTLNATLAMAKQKAGVPFREVIGEGTGGLNEKGYPMMTSPPSPGRPPGIHGTLLDTIQSGEPISMMTNTKPANFAPNVAGDRSRVTADTHAIRGAILTYNELHPGGVPENWLLKEHRAAYKENPASLTPDMIDDSLASATTKKYDYGQVEYGPVADVYHRVAEILGVSPAEAQSMSWFGLGGQTNLGSELKTLSEIFDERLSVTAQALDIPVKEAASRVFRREIPLLEAGVPVPPRQGEKEPAQYRTGGRF